MEPDSLGTLDTANPDMADTAALRARLDDDGYVFLRDVIDGSAMAATATRFFGELRSQGLVDDERVWSGKHVELVDEGALHASIRYDDLWHHPSMTAVFALLFDEPVYVFKQTQIRLMFPGTEGFITPPHQDGAYIGPTQEFVTVWVPLTEGNETVGGIALAGGSHKQGLREHVVTELRPFNAGPVKYSGVPLETIEEPWLTADFHPGDVVIFAPYTVHRSLPNRSPNAIRLSMDTRVQPESVPRGYVATHTALEVKEEAARQAGWFPDVRV
jgi:ectoine hydroxylase-related dioxygenase (phytanoyl-CoA dioxygenase family)